MKKIFQVQCIILILIMMQINTESRTVNGKFKYNKTVMKRQENAENNEKSKVVKCSELPAPVLNDILGAAFNSR